VEMQFEPEKIGQPISASTAKRMHKLLAGVVEEGTGKPARMDNYAVAGKTGTAQKYNPNGGGYYSDKFMSSFVGFLPAENPEISIIVVADDPRGAHYGSTVCAPAFKEIAQFAVGYLRIDPEGRRIYVVRPDE